MDEDEQTSEDSAVRLWRAMLRATLTVGGPLRGLLTQWGLTPPRWDVLQVLAEGPPQGLRLSDIGERLLVTGGNVTGIVDHLESAGLVERLPLEEDRRVVLARMTPRGREVYEHVAPEHRRRVAALLAGTTAQQRKALIAMLEQVERSVREANGGAHTD